MSAERHINRRASQDNARGKKWEGHRFPEDSPQLYETQYRSSQPKGGRRRSKYRTPFIPITETNPDKIAGMGVVRSLPGDRRKLPPGIIEAAKTLITLYNAYSVPSQDTAIIRAYMFAPNLSGKRQDILIAVGAELKQLADAANEKIRT